MGWKQLEETIVNEADVRKLFEGWVAHLSAEAEYELQHPDYVMEMPQSGERIRGRDNMRAMQEVYPAPRSISLRRIVGEGDIWVVEAETNYSGKIYRTVDIVEFRDGKLWRETRYYAEPFDAPRWRARWVEPIAESDAPAAEARPQTTDSEA